MSEDNKQLQSGDIVYHTEREIIGEYVKPVEGDFQYETAFIKNLYDAEDGTFYTARGDYHFRYLRYAKNSEVAWYEQQCKS